MENENTAYNLENELTKLTAKNSDYVHSLTRHLSDTGQSEEEIQNILLDIVPQIIEAQKNGTTARALLGAPTNFSSQYKKKKSEAGKETNKNPYLTFLDAFLLVGALLSALNGMMVYFGRSQTVYGLTTLLFSSAAGAFALYQVYKIQLKSNAQETPLTGRQRLITTLIMIAYMMGWLIVTWLSSLIPIMLNPQIPGLYLLVLGLILFGCRYLLKRRFNIQSAVISAAERRK